MASICHRNDNTAVIQPQLSFLLLLSVQQDVVERAKSEMNVDFEANRLTPSDEKYVWDKKVDFAPPVGKSDWDDDDD